MLLASAFNAYDYPQRLYLLSGKSNNPYFWLSQALPCLSDREKVTQILDPALEGHYSMKDAVQVAAIASMCVQPEADYRPLMADVVQSLVPLVKKRLLKRSSSSSASHACKPLVKPEYD